MPRMITSTIVTFVCILIAFAVIDSVWIGFVASKLYKAALGQVMLDKFRVVPAVAFYLLQIIGMMVFVVPHGQSGHDLGSVAVFGALYGLFTYATFDLTNYAILRDWTLLLTVTDIAWGCVLSAAASTVGVALSAWVMRAIG